MSNPPNSLALKHATNCAAVKVDLHLEREADEGEHLLHEQSLAASGHTTIELSLARRQAKHLEAPGVAE